MSMEPYLLSDKGLLQSIANRKRRLQQHILDRAGKTINAASDRKRAHLTRELFLAQNEWEKRKISAARSSGTIISGGNTTC